MNLICGFWEITLNATNAYERNEGNKLLIHMSRFIGDEEDIREIELLRV